MNVGKPYFTERIQRLFTLEKHAFFRGLDRLQKMSQTMGSRLMTRCFVSFQPSNQFRNIC